MSKNTPDANRPRSKADNYGGKGKPHRWKPGESGNPTGRPKNPLSAKAVAIQVLAAKCEMKGKDGKVKYKGKSKLEALFERLWEVSMAKNDTRAARLLLEYAFGKPEQIITGSQDSNVPIRIQLVGAVDADSD